MRKETIKIRIGRILPCIIFLTLMFSAVILQGENRAFASSADITLSADADRVSRGDRVTIYLDISAEVYPGDFEGYITYNEEVFEYVSGPECVAGGEGLLRISDTVTSQSQMTRKYALSFKAISRGEGEFSMKNSPELYEFEEGYLMSVAVTPVTVTVSAAAAEASDASLQDMRCNPGTLTPEFNPDVTEYSTEVDYNTDKLIVSAHAKEMSSSVEVAGNDALVVGQNRITVTVTAENGNEKKYVIYCVKTGADDVEEAIPTDAVIENDSTIGLKNIDGIIYIYGRFDFEVSDIPEGFSVPEGYTETTVVMNGQAVKAYVRSDAPDDDFLLMILKDASGEDCLYCYDRVDKTIQRYESGSLSSHIEVGTGDDTDALSREVIGEYEAKISTLTFVIIIMCIIIAMLMIFVIRLYMKKKSNDDLD